MISNNISNRDISISYLLYFPSLNTFKSFIGYIYLLFKDFDFILLTYFDKTFELFYFQFIYTLYMLYNLYAFLIVIVIIFNFKFIQFINVFVF